LLPRYSDPDGDDIIVTVASSNQNKPLDFIVLLDRTLSISPKVGHKGTYNITITLKDVNVSPLTSEYSLKL